MENLQRRRLLTGGMAATLGGLIAPRLAFAASSYPDRPIKLVSPFAAGGATDIPARLLAQKMFDGKANIFVDNIAGAGATIGSGYVAKAPPDGYTLLISNLASQGIAPSLYPSLPYDAMKSFAHICLIGSQPNALVVKASSPYRDLQALIAACKAAPGKLTFGSAGIGSSPHLSGVLLQVRTQTKALHVPYKGTPPALVALLSGEITFTFANVSAVLPQVQSGAMRAIGITSAHRSPLLPDVPTIQEQGVSDFALESWHGLSAPAGTPDNVIQVLNAQTRKVLEQPDSRDYLSKLGLEPQPDTPAQYTAFVAAEIKKWGELVKLSNAGASSS